MIVLCAFLFTLFFIESSLCTNPNNVCPTFRDYLNIRNNSNCWYDFAAEMKVPDIIKKSGYPFVEYKVKTKDGYILTVFRIPGVASKKPPIFMLHGVQSTSGIFVGLGKHSMAFLLHDAGYDIWLGNYRGTEYSEGHESLNVTQKEYWNYSVDEIALNDVPAMLQLVRYHTLDKGKIIYIGHSLGTTAALMYASEYPDAAANNVGLFILLTPAYKLSNMRSPYRFLFPLLYPVLDITNALNIIPFISRGNARNVTRPLCLSSPPMMIACLNILNLFLGPFTQISPETIPVYFNQIPGGTSLKTISYLAEATRGQFRKYNYGVGKNRFLYGSDTPPEYDIKRIKVPIYIMYAARDWTITKEDSLNLYRELPKEVRYGIYEISNLNFNHYDFLFGRDSKKLVTDKLLEVLKKATGEE
ncbi:lipase 3-like [Anoplophora glabripennis]|uniref:lipase 3-like n=1 Tax=Anoplophora glabripennis TaxID=217634 RepID=UPI0008759458|nr:lipase 3-like [Anoplophora glabripennis]